MTRPDNGATMGNIRAAFQPLITDGRLDLNEAKTLTTRLDADAPADLQAIAKHFGASISDDAWAELAKAAQSIGVSLAPRVAVSLLDQPELSAVASGAKSLSTASGRKDPGVKFVQAGLMLLARLTGNAALGLPKYGADGDLGGETTNAVKALQKLAALPETGAVDKATLVAIHRAIQDASAPPAQLKNPRFTDAAFAQIASGAISFSRGAKGDAVKAVQTALIDLGYVLPKFGADGDFGGETIFAITQFQKARGLTPTGKLDQRTLKELDAVATQPGAKATLYPEYDQMMKDGVMSFTFGIGYDETGAHIDEIRKAKNGFASRGFQEVAPGAFNEAQWKAVGVDSKTIDPLGTYFVKQFTFDGKTQTALIKYIDANTPNARQRYLDGFKQSDVVLYGGHARYGSGPDFDDVNSPDGNVVIGANAQGHKNGSLVSAYDAHIREVLKNAPNVLETEALTKDYQMMVFSGCTTDNYLDELRAVPKNKDSSNLDTMTSNEILYWNNMTSNLFITIDSLMTKKSKNHIEAELLKNNGVGFTADGFGGNRYQP